ncbi:MAG: hypothetical protein EOP35_02580 [Rubrivivax sp.]|nr:MAG: hypothetical protein EOP35_02580 [Rubrivivax sp.]
MSNQPWRFYDAETGVLLRGSMLLPNVAAVEANTPAGHLATQVDVDPLTQRIDVATGEPVAYTPPAVVATWDAPSARAERDRLLAACDWVVARAYELGAAVPAPWAAYRAALRSLTEQPGFPASISWPTAPTT